jgi:hypothetical protein
MEFEAGRDAGDLSTRVGNAYSTGRRNRPYHRPRRVGQHNFFVMPVANVARSPSDKPAQG